MSAVSVVCPLCGNRYFTGMVLACQWPKHVCPAAAVQKGEDDA